MRRRFWLRSTGALAVLLLGLSVAPTRAQEAAGKAKEERPPGRAGATPLVSPEVHPDRRVTFRLNAPGAKEVTVSGEWGGGAGKMTREENGVWSVTVGPLAPDIFGYSFTVDGFQTLDPVQSGGEADALAADEPPGGSRRPAAAARVPGRAARHGARARVSLTVAGQERAGYTFTPPPATIRTRKRGIRCSTCFMARVTTTGHGRSCGRAHLIADNLLAQGKAQPMIIVMPDGHAAPTQPRPPGGPGAPGGGMSRNVLAFERDLLEDVMPFVEANYRTRPDPANRAIAGLSMGGGQSLTIGLNHPDRFAWVGGFSEAVSQPATAISAALADPRATDRAIRLIWIACGKDDRLIKNAGEFSAALKEHGIEHEFQTTEGNHSWPVWRRYLAEFVPRLFVAKP